eukprot:gnl/MRDRNA2_/MRDRNA2_114060_c0_seq1.p1 gnl/MRDRNA2_/MRDRNA2_114060_c0~~gnl/MRDRNA2_/MRDRNA2_114060_c0_seq1.p1  ORF type:complete len:206 (+),score=45.56 gnl/MRDRNA2_/MRDRNA2_114060_c0_seq1:74-691(+)
MTNLPKLTYFNAAGRAWALRVSMFKAFGKDGWTDDRFAYQEWPDKKPQMPLGFVPILELPGKGVISQTDAITRWAAKKAGLYPSDEDDALIVDEVCSTIIEVLNKTPGAGLDAEEKKKKRLEYAAGFLTTAFKQLETRLAPGPWILGDQFTVADLMLSTLSNMIVTGDFDHVPKEFVDAFPLAKAHNDKVLDHELVVAYSANYAN